MLWLHVLLPFTAWRRRAAVLHAPVNWGPWWSPCPTVVTIHDLSWERVPEAFPENFRRYARLFARRSTRRARRVIAVSESTARDLQELYGIPPERLRVVPNGVYLDTRPPGPREPFLLSVGILEPRKRIGAAGRGARALLRERPAGSGAVPADRGGRPGRGRGARAGGGRSRLRDPGLRAARGAVRPLPAGDPAGLPLRVRGLRAAGGRGDGARVSRCSAPATPPWWRSGGGRRSSSTTSRPRASPTALGEVLADREALRGARGGGPRGGRALLVDRRGHRHAGRLPAGSAPMTAGGRAPAWRRLFAHSYRLGAEWAVRGARRGSWPHPARGPLPAAGPPGALALLRAGPGGGSSRSAGTASTCRAPSCWRAASSARGGGGGWRSTCSPGEIAAWRIGRPGPRPARGGRAGALVRGRLVRRRGVRLGHRARGGRGRRRGDGGDVARAAAGRGPAPDHQRGRAARARSAPSGRCTATPAETRRPAAGPRASSSSATTRRTPCGERLLALPWREEAREYVRERRPVHERFFAARPWSFLAGGLLPLACVRNFARHPGARSSGGRRARRGVSAPAAAGWRRGAGSFGARRVTRPMDLRQYDPVVRAANRHGISLMRTMRGDPRWPADPLGGARVGDAGRGRGPGGEPVPCGGGPLTTSPTRPPAGPLPPVAPDERRPARRDARFVPLLVGPAGSAAVRRLLSLAILVAIDLTACFAGHLRGPGAEAGAAGRPGGLRRRSGRWSRRRCPWPPPR